MIDLSDFIGDNDIYAMKDKIFELLENEYNLENILERTPKQNDKEALKKQLATINKDYYEIHPVLQKITTMLSLNL